jgi:GDP-L-fucose synthase
MRYNESEMGKNSKIFVAGHRGLVGSAIVRKLQSEGYSNLLLKTHTELDLLDQSAVAEFFAREKPEYVFLAAAKVGGIMANKTYPAEFIYQNLVIETNIIESSFKCDKIAFSRKFLHLSKDGTTANKRRIPAHERT